MQPAALQAFETVLAKGSIAAADVLSLRHGFYRDGAISRTEADALFRLHEECKIEAPAEWSFFFIEAITEAIVYQEQPRGYINDEEAEWLLEHILHDGKVSGGLELSLLLHVLDRALSAPNKLKEFAVAHLCAEVIRGEGPSLEGHKLTPGAVDEVEVDMLRRILYAPGGDGQVNITTAEANPLCAIDEATKGGNNSLRWPVLFANAMSQHLMGYIHFTPVSEKEQLRRERWVADVSASGPRFASRMLEALLSGEAFNVWLKKTPEKDHSLEMMAKTAEAEQVTSSEMNDLKARLWKDGQISMAERAMLDKIGQLVPELAPQLNQLKEKP
jgi:hypothetical protein